MPVATISKQQVLAALTADSPARDGQGHGDDHDGGGLAALSMDELAANAGVSRATLYRLFPGKMALFAELVRRFSPFEPIAAVLETMGNRPPAEVIPAVAHAMATAVEGRIGLLLQLLLEVSRGNADRPNSDLDTSQDVAQAMRTLPLVAHYLSEQMAAGHLRPMDPFLAAQALIGPIVMHVLSRSEAASPPGGRVVPLPLEEVVDEFASLWLRAMTADKGEHHPGRRR